MSRPTLSATDFPEYVRAVVRAVLQSFKYEADKYTVQQRAQGEYRIVFRVPKTETITYANMIAVRDACRRARVCVQWNKDHLLFVVKVPSPPLRRQPSQPRGQKRPRTPPGLVLASPVFQGHGHKKQRRESSDDQRVDTVSRR